LFEYVLLFLIALFNMNIRILLFVFQSIYLFNQITGHGYLADPPARSSAWLYDRTFPQYYNHLEMSCGGTYHQWTINSKLKI